MSSKHRDLEAIAFDMAKCLGIYSDSYSGSPYRESAELVLDEYKKYLGHWQGLRTQNIDGWGALEGKLISLLSDDGKDLSEVLEKVKEVIETFKCFKQSDSDRKLGDIIKISHSLRSVEEEF